MCGWALKPSFAASPARSTNLANPALLSGAPRVRQLDVRSVLHEQSTVATALGAFDLDHLKRIVG